MASKKIKKKIEREAKKEVKSWHPLTLFIVVLTFVIATAGGFFALNFLQKNDKFDLVGDKEITLNVGDTYVEPGISESVECLAFGQDQKEKVFIVEEKTTFTEESTKVPGTYFIVYGCSSIKYSNIERVRTIIVSE